MTKYEAIQTNILNALLDAHNKQVSTNILTHNQLKIQLQKINSAVDANILVPGEDAHDELRALHSLMSIQATTSHGQIIFKITHSQHGVSSLQVSCRTYKTERSIHLVVTSVTVFTHHIETKLIYSNE